MNDFVKGLRTDYVKDTDAIIVKKIVEVLINLRDIAQYRDYKIQIMKRIAGIERVFENFDSNMCTIANNHAQNSEESSRTSEVALDRVIKKRIINHKSAICEDVEKSIPQEIWNESKNQVEDRLKGVDFLLNDYDNNIRALDTSKTNKKTVNQEQFKNR